MSSSTPLKPSARVSGGQPNGFPDFKPINKLPDHEIRELLKKTLKPALYQVRVDDRKKGNIAVGPKGPVHIIEPFANAISTQIQLGREKDWANPIVTLVI
jgi:hypothetical protein